MVGLAHQQRTSLKEVMMHQFSLIWHEPILWNGAGGLDYLTPAAPKLLLVDDDPIFNMIMTQHAGKAGIPMDTTEFCEPSVVKEGFDYDVVLIDYGLGSVCGLDLAAKLHRFVGDVPTIIISQSHRSIGRNELQGSIKCFCLKSLGPTAIIDRAIRAHTGQIS